jgi:LCP family protein required for cell wall assembly
VVLVIVALLVAAWIYVDSSLNRVDAIGDYQGRPAAGAGTNWLIVGSDSRQGLTPQQAAKLHTGGAAAVAGKRTDTIILLHLPDNGTKPTMVSILRDSYVPIPGHDRNKINAAFAYGGPKLLVRTVEQDTGLRIEHYAEIGFGGFAGLVDDVGGVKQCVDKAVKDSYSGLDLSAGCHTLDGAQALAYVRSRHAFGSDFARTQHQRQFIGKLANKIASPGTLLNPFRSVPLLFDIPGALTVDNGDHLQNLIAMGWDVRGVSSGGVVTTAVPIAGHAGTGLLWDQNKAQQLFHDLNHDQKVPDSLVTNH